jgi:CHASE2 domain-containing sensor protein
MLDVLRGRVDPSLFTNKIVVIGATSGSTDFHRTPFTSGATMPNGELQANAISTVRHGPALRTAGAGIVSLLILALSLTALPVAPVRWWLALAIFVGVAGVYLLLAQLLFDDGLYLSLVYPLLALALAALGTLIARVYLARQKSPRPSGVVPSTAGRPTSASTTALHEVGPA